MDYMIRMYAEGRMHYLYAETYGTALLAAQALYECTAHSTLTIWKGKDLLWEDGTPVEVGA